MRSEGTGVEAKPFAPPLSGAVLGHVIDAFDLRRFDGDGSLGGTNARRYLRGDRVSPEAEFEMHVAFAKAVVEAGLLPPLTVADILGPEAEVPAEVPVTMLLVPLVSQYAKHWDALAGALRRLAAPVAFPGHATGACLRLLAIDLSVRLTALLWLARVADERPLLDFWTKPNGTGLWLRSLHRRCTPDLSRDNLADAVRVHIKTLDGWLDDGVRPTHENLIDLANELAARNVGDAAALLRQLRLAFGARRLFEEIEKVVGTPQALGICERTVGYANMMLVQFPRASAKSQSENDLKMRMVLSVGTLGRGQLAMKWVAAMLNAMWRQDPNPVWRTSLRAVTGSWFEHLQDVAAKLGPIDADGWQELAAHLGHEPTEDDLHRIAYGVQATKEQWAHVPGMAEVMDSEILEGGKIAALELKLRAVEVANGGDRGTAIEMLRAALREDPLDAEIHFRLGCHLWKVGDAGGGIAALATAVQLRPMWDRPRVEIAIVLLNTRRDEEAIERLLASRAALDKESGWLLLHLAYSYERVSKPAEAIAAYEKLLQLEPANGEALDRLAHLYFAMGDRRKGADRAKQAAHLGIPTVLHAFEKRYYDKKPPPNERPPHLMSRDLVQFPDDAWPRRR